MRSSVQFLELNFISVSLIKPFVDIDSVIFKSRCQKIMEIRPNKSQEAVRIFDFEINGFHFIQEFVTVNQQKDENPFWLRKIFN